MPINFSQFRILTLPGGNTPISSGVFHACRLRLAEEMSMDPVRGPSSVTRMLLDEEAPPSALDFRIRCYQLHGVLSGFRNQESLVPKDWKKAEIRPEDMGSLTWAPETIVDRLREGALPTTGRLTSTALWVAEVFFEAGCAVFRSHCMGRVPKSAWTAMSRNFGRWTSWCHDSQTAEKRAEEIRELARKVAALLVFDYQAGLRSGFAFKDLYGALHLRDAVQCVAFGGRRLGRLEALGVADVLQGRAILQIGLLDDRSLENLSAFDEAWPRMIQAYDELTAKFARSENTGVFAAVLEDCRKEILESAVLRHEDKWLKRLEMELCWWHGSLDRVIKRLPDSSGTRALAAFLRQHPVAFFKWEIRNYCKFGYTKVFEAEELVFLWNRYGSLISEMEGAGKGDGVRALKEAQAGLFFKALESGSFSNLRKLLEDGRLPSGD